MTTAVKNAILETRPKPQPKPWNLGERILYEGSPQDVDRLLKFTHINQYAQEAFEESARQRAMGNERKARDLLDRGSHFQREANKVVAEKEFDTVRQDRN